VSHYFTVTDPAGSCRVVVDMAGRVSQSASYFPDGLPVGRTDEPVAASTEVNDRLYESLPYIGHAGAGWTDNGARFLDNDLGRFLSPDKHSGSYPWLSPYANRADNPFRFADPTGNKIIVRDSNGKKYRYKIGREKGSKAGYFVQLVFHSLNEMNGYLKKYKDPSIIRDLVKSKTKIIFEPNSAENFTYTKEEHPKKESEVYVSIGLKDKIDNEMNPDASSVEAKPDYDWFYSQQIFHETTHAYQFIKGVGGRSIENEIEAYTIEYMTIMEKGEALGRGYSIPADDCANSIISLTNDFNDEVFQKAVSNFLKSPYNSSGLYNEYGRWPEGTESLLKQFNYQNQK
jgi:RHS repeat-associated protein